MRSAGTASIVPLKTWRCSVPGCGFSIQYRKVVPGRAIGKHRRDMHGTSPAGPETASGRGPVTPPNPSSRFCPMCGGDTPTKDVLRVMAALMGRGVDSQTALETAELTVKVLHGG